MGFNDETWTGGIQDLTFISHKKCNKYSNGIWEHWSRFSSHYIVHIETYLTNIQMEFGSIEFWNQFFKKKTCISKSIKLSLVFKFICQWSWFLVIEAWVGTLLQRQLTYKLQHSMFNGSYKLPMTLHLLQIHKHHIERFIMKFVILIT